MNSGTALRKSRAIKRATLSNLVGEVDTRRQHGNLSSTIRLFVLDHYRNRMAALASKGAEADGPMPAVKQAVRQSF